MEIAYSCRGLKKAYNSRPVLDLERLDFAAGRLHLLVGGNGTGKTTLLEILAGLAAPSAGEVRCLGQPLPAPPAATRRLAGRVTLALQHPFLFRGTVGHNVAYGLPGRGRTEKEREGIARWLAELGLEGLANRDTRELSGGERQRVALARAFVLETPIVLLDEPLAHVDGEHRRRVGEIICRLRDSGRTLVVAAHDRRRLGGRADRILTLENGRARPGGESEGSDD